VGELRASLRRVATIGQDLSSKKPPKRVIPLDHYCIQSVSNEPPVYTFSLRRDPTLGIDDAEVFFFLAFLSWLLFLSM
jgi:hypothetical protein